MVLKRIASALLPPESRENILGDLEERGFRLRDAVSVIVASNASALRREWLGPVPNFDNASDLQIQRRTAQLLRGQRLLMSGAVTGFLLLVVPMSPVWALALTLLLFLALPVGWTLTGTPRDNYRRLLSSHSASVAFAINARGWVFLVTHSLFVCLPLALALAAILNYRRKRLEQELKFCPPRESTS